MSTNGTTVTVPTADSNRSVTGGASDTKSDSEKDPDVRVRRTTTDRRSGPGLAYVCFFFSDI